MLDYLAILQAKEICQGATGFARYEDQVRVGRHHVTLGDDAFDMQTKFRVFAAKPIYESDKCFGAILCLGVVLGIAVAEMLRHRSLRISIECRLVVIDNNLLVLLFFGHDTSFQTGASNAATVSK